MSSHCHDDGINFPFNSLVFSKEFSVASDRAVGVVTRVTRVPPRKQ
jgi:hypothetical protein